MKVNLYLYNPFQRTDSDTITSMSTDNGKKGSPPPTKEETTVKIAESSEKEESKSVVPQDEESEEIRTIKHEKLVKDKIGNKKASELPGIGKCGTLCLEDKEITKAYQVLAHFLLCDKDQGKFTEWLKKVNPAANKQHQKACYDALKQLCEKYLD